jgi:dTDP-4-dehydrorhamnose reductase
VNKQTILLTGARGQLGKTFSAKFSTSELQQKFELVQVGINELNLSDTNSVTACLSSYNPSVIINCGAYTSVDLAEGEKEEAMKVNASAVASIAKWANENQSRMLQISTDFVFDGKKTAPYSPTDIASPLSVYGETKLLGEKGIFEFLPKSGIIIRTSWLYSENGKNFVKKMLDLMSKKDELGIVSDQVGSPTSTHSLVEVLFAIINRPDTKGIYHWCDGASVSWFEFAIEIQKLAMECGLLRKEVPINPIKTSDFPTKARRPSYSVLEREATILKLGVPKTDWRKELKNVLVMISLTKLNGT